MSIFPNTKSYLSRLIKTNPFEILCLARTILTTAKYRYLLRCVGSGTVVGVDTKIINSANVFIGKGYWLQDEIYIRAGLQGRILIGDRVAINSFCKLFGHGTITIGDDTQIGPASLITTTEHDFHNSMQSYFKPVKIGRRVWIGAGVIVLPGVEIGDFAVVGAGRVVTRNIPCNSVAVGVPARVIKRLSQSESVSKPMEGPQQHRY